MLVSLSRARAPSPVSLFLTLFLLRMHRRAYARAAHANVHTRTTAASGTRAQQQPLEHVHNSSLWITPTCSSLSRPYSHITSLLPSVSPLLLSSLSCCLSPPSLPASLFLPPIPSFCSARSLLAICRSALLCLCREIPAAPTAIWRKRYNA